VTGRSPERRAAAIEAANASAKAVLSKFDEQRHGKPSKKKFEFHPLAVLFPLLEGDEFKILVEDIRRHGQREPIVLYQGRVLDGRNRARACKAAGVAPRYEEFSGRDAAAYVISANIRRRHLTTEQRRDLIAKLLKDDPGRSDRQVAETVKASPSTVGTVRAKMEESGDVSKLDTRTDTTGRRQPAKKATTAATTALDALDVIAARAASETRAKASPASAESEQEALFGQVCQCLASMTEETRRRIFAHIQDKYAAPDLPTRGDVKASKAEFGRRLEAARVARGWNQSELVRRATMLMPRPAKGQMQGLKIGRDAIWQYCRGRSLPRPEALDVIAKALGMAPDELMPPGTRARR
jgi:hypothetical protein